MTAPHSEFLLISHALLAGVAGQRGETAKVELEPSSGAQVIP